jgi:tight adherence protein C
MVLLAIIGLVLAGGAVGLLAWSLVLPRAHAVARLQEIDAYGFAATPAVVGAATVLERPKLGPVTAIAGRLGDLAVRYLGQVKEDDLRTELVAAGLYTTPPRTLLGYRVLGALLLAVLMPLTGVASSAATQIASVVFGLWVGWTLPLILVRRRARSRVTKIDLALPDLIDQLVVTVEAGVGFSNSMQFASGRMKGPLGDELRLMLQEQRMGASMQVAMQHLLDRADTPNTRSFVRAVSQGEALGVSIGTVMRNLAIEMRKRRRASAEERAQKAPVKMLFPLIFCIFPAMFIVLLVPALMNIAHTLSGG